MGEMLDSELLNEDFLESSRRFIKYLGNLVNLVVLCSGLRFGFFIS